MARETKYLTVTVFKSFIDVVEQTFDDPADKGRLYSAFMMYSLYGIEPADLQGVAAAFFELVKPNIRKSNSRRDARSGKNKETEQNTVQNAVQNTVQNAVQNTEQNSRKKTDCGEDGEKSADFVPPFVPPFCPPYREEEEEEEETKKEKKKNSVISDIEKLPEPERNEFIRWLTIWEHNFGNGKPMNELQQENQLRRLLLIPQDRRLAALTASCDGGWKQIHDPRSGGGRNFDAGDPATWE